MTATLSPSPTRWGILATGGIAGAFAKDLLVAPSSRNVTDVAHTITAAASSTSAARAREFLTTVGAPAAAKAHGSYAELAADPDVDIIYIATPHSHHFQNAMQCLRAGKPVLVEKPMTVNAAQARLLVETARANGVFLMEAMWIRFFPLCIELRDLVTAGHIGRVLRVIADLSFGGDVEKDFGTTHRMVNPALAGGAMLDIGIYPLTWVFQFLFHIVPEEQRSQPKVTGSLTKYEPTGTDDSTVMVLTFPRIGAVGIAMSSLRVGNDGPHDLKVTDGEVPTVRIQGDKGEIQVYSPAYRPERYRVVMKDGKDADAAVTNVNKEIPGKGLFWEADECARCLRDGTLESQGMSWNESIAVMQVMDEIRKQNELKYPDNIESVEYPLEGF